MKPAPFAYHRPTTLDDAVALLADVRGGGGASVGAGGGVKVLAGGQSLVPLMSMRLASPEALVDLNQVDGLGHVEVDDVAVRVGALVRHSALERHDEAYTANPLLRRALEHVAHPTIRNRGTTVGSIVHADPAAEMPAVLRLLGGSVDVVSQVRGRRSIDAAELVVGPLESALADDEIAVAASFPHPPPGTGSSWFEIARRHGDYAVVGLGGLVTVDPDRHVTAAAVCLIGVAGTPLLVDLTPVCSGAAYDDLDPAGTRELLDSLLEPEGDIHASAEYRRHLAHVLTGRAVTAAAQDAVSRVAA